jgi:uncharacterized protein
MRLWRPLADSGDALAQFYLGETYRRGQGVPKDYAQAVIWYRKAADQGQVTAAFVLGAMYEQGQGVPQDYIQAYTWYNITVSRARIDSSRIRAAKARDLIAAKMTPAQIAEAQRRTRVWIPKE